MWHKEAWGFLPPPPVTFTWWGLDPENAGSPKHSVRDGTLGVQSPRQAHTSCVSPAIRLDGGCLIRKMEFGVERTAPHVRRDPVLFFPDIAAISPKENHTRGPCSLWPWSLQRACWARRRLLDTRASGEQAGSGAVRVESWAQEMLSRCSG